MGRPLGPPHSSDMRMSGLVAPWFDRRRRGRIRGPPARGILRSADANTLKFIDVFFWKKF